MKNLKNFRSIKESSETTHQISAIEPMAKSQKYGYQKSPAGGIYFTLKVNDIEYFFTIYDNGRFGVIQESPNKEVLKGNWFTTPWGATFEYKDKKGETNSSASTGLNAIDMPIAWGVLGLNNSYKSFIKSTDGNFISTSSPYSPGSQKCINPKSLSEITSGKCILTTGSRGDTVKTVQSSLNFVLNKEALDLLGGNTYDKAAISNVKEVNLDTDGIFGKNTKNAVEEFQKIKGGLTVDGVVGKGTLTNLISVKEEIIDKEKKELEAEIKRVADAEAKKVDSLPTKELEPIKSEVEDEGKIKALAPIEVQVEVEKTMKELREEKKDSRKRRRLLKRLERLQKRERKVQDKIDKLSESSLTFLSDYDTYIAD
jgi:hypothetical protein